MLSTPKLGYSSEWGPRPTGLPLADVSPEAALRARKAARLARSVLARPDGHGGGIVPPWTLRQRRGCRGLVRQVSR